MVSDQAEAGGLIRLLDEEQRLFDLLLRVVDECNLSTELRCAGGWVRDKLLGKESSDIDIALDNMMGEDFAERLNEYLVSHGEEGTSVAVIQSNPEKSKHLETAKVKFRGLEIDLVNLRSEAYASTSRIPTIEFGTAEQDAMRRDFTVNALFYNIKHGTVEDLTKHGLSDLRKGLLRTPLPAHQTFMDDPLRVLRAIRFASRLDFELHSDIAVAGSSEDVRTALDTKVSRERITAEFEATLQGPDPKAGLLLIDSFGILDIVLGLPEAVRSELKRPYHKQCIHTALAFHDVLRTREEGLPSAFHVKIGLLAALLLPLRNVAVEGAVKKKAIKAPEYVVGFVLKRKKEAAMVSDLHAAAVTMSGLSQSIGDVSEVGDEYKVALGLAIRQAKDNWGLAVALAFTLGFDFSEAIAEVGDAKRAARVWSEVSATEAQEYVRQYREAVVSLKLDRAWTMKPMLNGKEVMQLLGVSGPQVGKIINGLINWQLAHPHATAEECKRWLLEANPRD